MNQENDEYFFDSNLLVVSASSSKHQWPTVINKFFNILVKTIIQNVYNYIFQNKITTKMIGVSMYVNKLSCTLLCFCFCPVDHGPRQHKSVKIG